MSYLNDPMKIAEQRARQRAREEWKYHDWRRIRLKQIDEQMRHLSEERRRLLRDLGGVVPCK